MLPVTVGVLYVTMQVLSVTVGVLSTISLEMKQQEKCF